MRNASDNAPREVVRPAVECFAYDSASSDCHVTEADGQHSFDDVREMGLNPRRLLGVDDEAYGGLVARVREAVGREYREWNGADHYTDDVVAGIVEKVCAALGVQP